MSTSNSSYWLIWLLKKNFRECYKFLNDCEKPKPKGMFFLKYSCLELIKVVAVCLFGIFLLGTIASTIKLIFIPMNNVIMGSGRR